MKYYLKIFLISFLCFAGLLGGVLYAFTSMKPNPEAITATPEPPAVTEPKGETGEQADREEEEAEPVDQRTELEKMIDATNRINVLVFGTDGARADMIMLVSYDPDNKLVDAISVPRDTYHEVKGHNRKDQKKINAVYGLRDDGGSEGMKKELANLLQVPIHYYVRVNYNGVAEIIDLIEGVEVTLPFEYDYDDEYSDPPLHIHFPAGKQVLNGEDSVKYLRWRQNNDGSHSDGDLGRIKRQQDFMIRAAKKAIGPKLPAVVKTGFNYVKTDMGLSDMVYYANSIIGFDFANIETYSLPGKWTGYYYVHDPAETEAIIQSFYQRSIDAKSGTQGE